jgi:hypothetical protein
MNSKYRYLTVALIGAMLLVPAVLFGQSSPNGSGEVDYNFNQLSGVSPFRTIPWGASKEYVLKNDPSARKETGKDYLVLTSTLAEIQVDITYFFFKGHFIKGTYMTTENLGDYSTYMEKYQRFKALLTEKYGRPKIDLVNWVDVTFKNRPEKWLTAVSRGHLEHFAFWELENKIIISIKFSSVNEQPSLKIEYYIKNFDDRMDKIDDDEILKDL